jgi:hypothetical protein
MLFSNMVAHVAGMPIVKLEPEDENERMIQPGQQVRVNLAGMQVGSVVFHAAVTDPVGTIIREVSDNPSKYLVKLLFSFRGVDEVEVPESRIVAK